MGDENMSGLETAFVSATIKGATGPATNALASWGRRKYDKFVATYTNALSEYIDDSIKQCKSVKNILYRDQLAQTDEKYVSVSFSREKTEVTDKSIVAALLVNRHVLIRGRGGAGKTMFTKWALLRLSESISQHQKIPIYISLRDLSVDTKLEFIENYIFFKISNNRTKSTYNQFIEGIKAGLFILILDAADEIKKDHRHYILKLINQFSRQFPETAILLTTRDFDEVDGISGFEQYRTKPLSKEQAIAILDKLDYRSEIKNDLRTDIEADKFSKHKFFLENPLLVTILLLTFDQSKDIPKKRSAFYKRAFEALYERHDGAKEGSYSRDHHAGLPMDEFEDVFGLFCYGTYINSNYDFSDSELVTFLKTAADQCGIDESAELIAKDALESACLLVKEGHENTFVHRSFQEYFCALYIKNYKENDISEIIEEALNNGGGENVLEFLHEMDQKSLEREYILPRLTKIVKRFREDISDRESGTLKFLRTLFKNVELYGTGTLASLHFSSYVNQQYLFGISSLYPETDILRIWSGKKFDVQFAKTWPLEKIAASACSKSRTIKNGPTFMTIRFTPSAKIWIDETQLPVFVEKFVSDLEALQRRLTKKYMDKKSRVGERFKGFSRD